MRAGLLLAMMMLLMVAPALATLDDNLENFFNLDDDISSTNVLSGNSTNPIGGNGTLIVGNSDAISSTTAITNRSFYFNTGDRVRFPVTWTPSTSDFTVTGWFQIDASDTTSSVFEIGTSDGWSTIKLVSVAGGTLQITCNNGGKTTDYCTTDITGLSTGVWYFFDIVRDSSEQTLNVTINRGEKSVNETGVASLVAPDNGTIGGRYSGQNFDGFIDNVGIWSAVKSVSELVELYNESSGLAYPFIDTAPSIDTVTLYSISRIVEVNSSTTDADNSTVAYTYQLYRGDDLNNETYLDNAGNFYSKSNTNIFNFTPYERGVYTVGMRAFDGTKNSSWKNSTVFNVSIPLVDTLTTEVSGNTLLISANSTINNFTTLSYEYLLYKDEVENGTAEIDGGFSVDDFVNIYNLTLTHNGEYIVQLRANDSISPGNWTNSTAFNVTLSFNSTNLSVSNAAPTVTTDAITLYTSCLGDASIQSALFTITDPNDETTNTSEAAVSVDVWTRSYTPSIVGNYTVFGWCKDASGNWNKSTGNVTFSSVEASSEGSGGSSGGGGGGSSTTTVTSCGVEVVKPVRKLFTAACSPGLEVPAQEFIYKNDAGSEQTFTFSTEGEGCVLTPEQATLEDNEQAAVVLSGCTCPAEGSETFNIRASQGSVCSENITVTLTPSKFAGLIAFFLDNAFLAIAFLLVIVLLVFAGFTIIKLSTGG